MSIASKNELQEYCVLEGYALPIYSSTRSGPSHNPVFVSTVEISGLGSWTGAADGTKRGADKLAAIRAIEYLRGDEVSSGHLGENNPGSSHGELSEKDVVAEPHLIRGLYSFGNVIPRGSVVDSSDIGARAKALIGDFEEGVLRRMLLIGKSAGVIFHPSDSPFKWSRSPTIPTYKIEIDCLRKAFNESIYLAAVDSENKEQGSTLIDKLRKLEQKNKKVGAPFQFVEGNSSALTNVDDGQSGEFGSDEFILLHSDDSIALKRSDSPRSRNMLHLHKELGNTMLERIEKGKRTECLVLLTVLYIAQSPEWKDLDGIRAQAISVNPYSRSRDIRQIARLLEKEGLVETNVAGNSLFAKPTLEGIHFCRILDKLAEAEWEGKDD